ncbi:MAG: YfhO family protein [Deltaproteobacteria bacterium]|nr:YfhO family protein [Deltaproteobacteria bacterium]
MEKRRLAVAGVVIFAVASAFLDIRSPRGFPDRYDPFTPPPYIDFLKDIGGHGRVMGGHGFLFPNYASAAGIQDIRYINSISPALFHEFRNRYLKPEDVYYHSLWFTGSGYRGESGIEESIIRNLKYYSFLGVKHIILPSEIDFNGTAELIYPDGDERPFFPIEYSDGSVSIYRNEYATPRAFVVGRVRYADSYKEAQEAISSGDFDVSKEAVLEKRLPMDIDWAGQGAGNAEIVEYGANRAVINASAEKDGILVLTDTFYPGWKAYVDGEPAEIYRVNGLVRGVFLRGGVHTVEFRYFPASFLAGLAISGVSISLMGLCFIFGKGRGTQEISERLTKPAKSTTNRGL